MTRKKDYAPLVGSTINGLIVIGLCQGGFRTPSGQAERRVPCKCSRCGREGLWKKGDVTKGIAGCRCKQRVVDGLSDEPEGIIFTGARKRARESGVPFALTVHDIVIPEFCPALGIRLERGSGRTTDASPTLDRLDPSLGYVPGNVSVISLKANRMKSNGTLEEIEALAAWMRTKKGASRS